MKNFDLNHNKGKFKEISFEQKNHQISPIDMKIKSPKETGKTFSDNSILKVKYFSKFESTNYFR